MRANALAVAADGRRLAIATDEGIHVIDLVANRDLGQLIFDPSSTFYHRGSDAPATVDEVSISPDGKRVVGASRNADLHVWNVP